MVFRMLLRGMNLAYSTSGSPFSNKSLNLMLLLFVMRVTLSKEKLFDLLFRTLLEKSLYLLRKKGISCNVHYNHQEF